MSDTDDPLADGAAELISAASGLPGPIAKPVVSTISQLLGALLAEPIAKARAKAQPIEDETYKRSLLARTEAVQAAALMGRDEAFARRALEAHTVQALTKYQNREAVAAQAVEELRAADPSDSDTITEPEADWINIYGSYAEQASSERAQRLWARVLAGQWRKPAAFSLRTLRFLSELDSQVAKTFEDYTQEATALFIPKRDELLQSPHLHNLLTLEEAGLITGIDGSLNMKLTIEDSGQGSLFGRKHVLVVEGRPQMMYPISAIVFTQVGREVLTLVDAPDDLPVLRKIVQGIKARITSAYAVRIDGKAPSVKLWPEDAVTDASATPSA